MSVRKEEFGRQKEEIENYQKVTAIGMKMLGGVRDQTTWNAAKAQARILFDHYGVPFPDLPEQYSADMVRDLQMQQLDIDQQIKAALDQQKFEWQRQDDVIDNARDDRRVAIQDRSARDASARGWSADRRAERRYQRGDGANVGSLSTDDLINMLGAQ